jgi:Domain of Unknown Function (DUF1080)
MRKAFLTTLLTALLSAAPPTAIFNGKDLTGWHISETNSHGNTKGWTVKDGVLTGTQLPAGNGGLFLRSNEKGQAYQVTIDYLEGGTGDKADREWPKHWKKNALSTLAPQVWMNGTHGARVESALPEWKSQRWVPGGYHRFRNIVVKELP